MGKPLSLRRDYGQQPEAAMFKEVPVQDYDEIIPEDEDEKDEDPDKDEDQDEDEDKGKEEDEEEDQDEDDKKPKDKGPIVMEDYDNPVVEEEEVQEDSEEPVVVSPAGQGAPARMRFVILENYDEPIEALPMHDTPIPLEQYLKGQAAERDEGSELECPHCQSSSKIDEPILKKKMNLGCPTCGGQVATASIYKTASGYKAVAVKMK